MVLLASKVVVPGVDILVAKMLFLVVDIVDYSAVSRTTPTTGAYGTTPAKGEYLAAVALKSEVPLMPLVDSAEGDLKGLVVPLDAFKNLGH